MVLSVLENVSKALLDGRRRAPFAGSSRCAFPEGRASLRVANELDHRATKRRIRRPFGRLALAGREENSISTVLDLRRNPHPIGESDRRRTAPQSFAQDISVGFAEGGVNEDVSVPIEIRHLGPGDLPREDHAVGGPKIASSTLVAFALRPVAHQDQGRVRLLAENMLREDPDNSVLRFLASVAPGAQEPRPPVSHPAALEELGIRIGAEGAVEDIWLNRPRNHMYRGCHPTLAPIRSKPFAQNDQAVALVVDVGEEPLEWPF
jgi:hypothetical protein